ncbi:MAG: allophanate hydrolase subunit 1 [Pseudomonadota bacterium]
MPFEPIIRTVGLSGLLVSFADAMSEPANRAALAFRAAVESEEWPEVQEISMSLVSVYIVADLVVCDIAALTARIETLLETRDWNSAPLPQGRTLWHVPTVYGTDLAPQLEETATAAGMDADEAVKQLSSARVRVLTIGFAPGQPYLGELDPVWNIPRQQALTQSVPAGALVTAIRQLIIFTAATPTGWRHIGQTGFRLFQPRTASPFALRVGDELSFPAISRAEFETIISRDASGRGGAEQEALP